MRYLEEYILLGMVAALVFLGVMGTMAILFEPHPTPQKPDTSNEKPIHYFNQPAQCFNGRMFYPCGLLEHEQDI